jgi:pyruvate formate-lyase/glycerol dehydratase family glycyl radical enzyme
VRALTSGAGLVRATEGHRKMENTVDLCASLAPAELWAASPQLSPRVRRLLDQYWSFYERSYTNEVRAFTTGTEWDTVYSTWSWTNVPEAAVFLPGFRSYLRAAATPVELPPGFWDEPLVVRRALFFREVARAYLPVEILDGELVVGSHFNTALSRCLNRHEARAREREEQAFLLEWHALNDVGVGNCGAVPGHLVPNYRKALRVGWKGLRDEAQAVAQAPASTREQRDLARAVVICAEAVREYARRSVEQAERLAVVEADPARRAELREIARNLRKVPWEPPATFPEALQALWTTHMLLMAAESYPGPGVSPGRVDQYLLPYYQADLAAGRLTTDAAKEWLECWWIKHNYAYDYQGWCGTNQGINSSFGQLITLGGMTADGADASNELTYLMLDVIEELNLLEPKPNIRLHAKTPERLLDRIVDALARAQGSPFLLNFDEASIAGLRWEGLPEELLWDYAPVGCLENTLAGCDRSGTVDVNLNLAKAVELALNDGCDMATGKQIGPRTGAATSFQSFEEFRAAFETQLAHLVDWITRVNDRADAGRARWEPVPYMSALVDGCLESGRDSNAGGARFNFLTVEGIALATAADSLAAVKQLVYDDRELEMAQLIAALRVNFEGYEPLRQTLLHKAPKYGNDDPAVDALARDISHFWTERVFQRTAPTGKRYRAGYLSWNYWIAYAPLTAATPDGRKRGQYLSNAVCPVNGADRKGPTAVIKSVGHLDLATAPNGASHTMSFSPSLLRNPEHRTKLKGLLRAYDKVGGTCLQINVIDADTLRAAQHHPDDYRNLLVRVTGYNAYFVGLGKEIQDELIARESHRA